MLSPRGSARLGLGAACLLCILSIALIGRGASDAVRFERNTPGRVADDFALADTTGKMVRLSDYRGSVVVLSFLSIHCPVSTEYDARLAKLALKYGADGRVKFLAVNSNVQSTDPAGPAAMEIAVQSRMAGLQFPLLLDPAADVAHRLGVEKTPTFVVIDQAGVIRYRGALDDNRLADRAKKCFLDDVLRRLVEGKPDAPASTTVDGCGL